MADVRPEPFFIADSVALDFLNSVAAPRAEEFEWLESGEDVLNWMVQSGLIAEEEIADLRKPKYQSQINDTAKLIRAFREEFRSFIIAASEAGQVDKHHPIIAKLNRMISEGKQTMYLVSNGSSGLDFKVVHRMKTPADLLPRLAVACAELIAGANFTYIRNCEGDGCTLFFRDVSKNHKRRWCSMEVCGNRAKAAAYRKRL